MNVYYKDPNKKLHHIIASSDYDGDPVLAVMDVFTMIKEDKMPCTSAIMAVINGNKGKTNEEFIKSNNICKRKLN